MEGIVVVPVAFHEGHTPHHYPCRQLADIAGPRCEPEASGCVPADLRVIWESSAVLAAEGTPGGQ